MKKILSLMGIVLPPQWFFAPDVLIDLFSFLVLIVFTIISLIYYKKSKNKSFFYLGISFLLIGLGQFFEIFMNLKIYYDLTKFFQLGDMIVASQVTKPLIIISYIASFFYRLFTLVGFYFLYNNSKKDNKVSRLNNLIVIYLLMVLTILTSVTFHFFCATSALFSLIISFNYYRVYKKTELKRSLVLSIAFILLFVSYMMMAFIALSPATYIFAGALQLVAFIILLYLMIVIFNHGKKLKKN
jgi:hypothetical protein